MRRLLSRVRDAAWWLPENRRSFAAIMVVIVLVVLPMSRFAGDTFSEIDLMLLSMAVYLAIYLVITVLAHRSCTQEQVRTWARSVGRGSWLQRYVTGAAPGPGLPISVGGLALLTGIVWLPRGEVLNSNLAIESRVVLGIVLIAVSWLAMNICFAVAYRRRLGDEHPSDAVARPRRTGVE